MSNQCFVFLLAHVVPAKKKAKTKWLDLNYDGKDSFCSNWDLYYTVCVCVCVHMSVNEQFDCT